MNRRGFLSHLSGLGGGLLAGARLEALAAPKVTATPTVFFAQPDGKTALIRFVVEGSDAPAGRLRVFDRARRQIATAGVIGRGGQLYGELWLPLERETEISSELELPGPRGVLRTTHRLSPRRRWTVYWMTAADALPSGDMAPEFLDHAEFLRLMEGARSQTGNFVLDSAGLLDQVVTAPLMLAGSGLKWIGLRDAPEPLSRIESHDGAFVIAVRLGETGTPRELGIAAGRTEMAQRIERWLDGAGTQLADAGHAVALVVATDPGDTAAPEERVADWNSRFAYPRIVTDRPDELLGIIEKRAAVTTRRLGARASDARWQAERRDAPARAARMFDPLLTRLSASATGLAALAEQFAFAVPGTLVVNPTPFPTTGIATMPDGTERMITDVPPLGYVCVPYPGYAPRAPQATDGRWVAVGGSDNDLTLDNSFFQLRIDLETGAIRSLVTPKNGRQWARGGGLNTAPGFRLDTLQKFRNQGVGTRILVSRRASDGSTLISSITTYDGLPWVDITNEQSAGPEPVTYGFGVALERPAASWEVPAGFDELAGAVERLVHLRWLRLKSGTDSVLFRGIDAPVASVTSEGEIVSVAPRRARYRLGFTSGFSSPTDPWTFGWSSEALLALSVPGTGKAALPSFGSLVVTDQAGVCIVELRSDPDGVIIYIQELIGTARDITVGPGVLSFRSARRVDFTGRDLGELPMLPSGGTSAPVRAFGITAVRLAGVELAAR